MILLEKSYEALILHFEIIQTLIELCVVHFDYLFEENIIGMNNLKISILLLFKTNNNLTITVLFFTTKHRTNLRVLSFNATFILK